jgi:DMSO reductase anchor subunit
VPREKPASYYGRPIIKPPVWTWEVPTYFFTGGLGGASATFALAADVAGNRELARRSWLIAFCGLSVSPLLLTSDLGKPSRFLNMLRVFKWRSAMSVGVWTLSLFGACSLPAFSSAELGIPVNFQHWLFFILLLGTALSGVILATYTGVLLGATAIPAWSEHHKLLPFHFGIVALGSAAAALELLGFRTGALHAIGLTVSALETGVGGWIEMNRKAPTARALHEGASGLLLRVAGLTTGPVALIARLFGFVPAAALCFLLGAALSRYGWLAAGHFSGRNPEETLAATGSAR